MIVPFDSILVGIGPLHFDDADVDESLLLPESHNSVSCGFNRLFHRCVPFENC